jgi:hypothetical protein
MVDNMHLTWPGPANIPGDHEGVNRNQPQGVTPSTSHKTSLAKMLFQNVNTPHVEANCNSPATATSPLTTQPQAQLCMDK